MQRKASAVWEGGIRHGKGSISTASGTLASAPYSFGTRFENASGTNPEELLGAAHAGCFSMALALQLGEAGITHERIDTEATVTLEKLATGFTITKVHLTSSSPHPAPIAQESMRLRRKPRSAARSARY